MDSNIFPLPFTTHIVFAAVAFLFFIVQFVRTKYKYEPVMAMAVAATMLIYLKDNKMWIYGIGILEFGLLIIALVLSVAEKKSRREAAALAAAADSTEEKDGQDEDMHS